MEIKVTCPKGHELEEKYWGELCPICHPLQKCPKCGKEGFEIIFVGSGRGIDDVGAFKCIECENTIWIANRIVTTGITK